MLTCLNKYNLVTAALLLHTVVSFAQRATHAIDDSSNTPLDLSNPFEVIVFILLPIIILILYGLYRKKNKEEKQKNQSVDKSKQNQNK